MKGRRLFALNARTAARNVQNLAFESGFFSGQKQLTGELDLVTRELALLVCRQLFKCNFPNAHYDPRAMSLASDLYNSA